jgi:anaerobic selenocysteine-containing dehydrogenase
MVCIDIFLNETTRHADIILPPPSHLEIDHYDLIFNLFSVSNNAKFSSPLFKAQEGQLYDWQIAKGLIKRFAKVSRKKPAKLYQWLTPRQILHLGLITGPYGKWSHPKRWFSGLSLNKLIRAKHGINLGPLKPRIPEVLNTIDRKINIAADVFINGLDQVIADLDDHPYQSLSEKQFLLIGRRHLRSNNSWMHNVEGLMKGRNRCTLMMHPQDAQKLALSNKQMVQLSSETGSIDIPLELTDHIMPGVLSIPHGFGHNKNGTQLDIATQAKNAGVSVNDITDQNRLDPVTGNAAFSGQLVSISAVIARAETNTEGNSMKP